MLRHNSSRRRRPQTLTHSKSANYLASCHRTQTGNESIPADPDAHIAARVSFERYYGRRTEGMEQWYFDRHDQTRHDQGTVRRDVARHLPHLEAESVGVEVPRRQKSIRFAGPDRLPRKRLIGRSSALPLTLISVDTGNVMSSEGLTSSCDSHTVDRIRELRVNNGYCTPENDSDSFSNPRLRKSRSLYAATDTHAKIGCYNNGTHQQEPTAWSSTSKFSNKENRPYQTSLSMGLRAPKSMSFLRGRREKARQQSVRSESGSGLGDFAAFDNLLLQYNSHSELKPQPPLPLRSKLGRSDGSFGLRKSLRNSSNNTTGVLSAFSSDSLAVPKGSLRAKARKVSNTFRSRMKGLFGRQKSSFGSLEKNVQQHNYDSDESIASPTTANESEAATVSRGPSRIAAVQAVSSPQQVHSRHGSFESVDQPSIADDKSRVTSWTDSVTNTVRSQQTNVDYDHPRLPVISEVGAQRSTLAGLEVSPESHRDLENRRSVDSQRVYSALMKRANEIRLRQDKERKEIVHEIKAHSKPPPRSSSIDQVSSSGWSPPTIRFVAEDDDVFQDKEKEGQESTFAPERAEKTKVRVSYSLTSSEGSPNPWSGKVDASGGKASFVKYADADHPKVCDHHTSTFFASPTSHMFRTTSPFRKALQNNMAAAAAETQAPARVWDTEYLGSMSAVSLPTRCQTPGYSERNSYGSGAESVYSSDGKAHRSFAGTEASAGDHDNVATCAENHRRSSTSTTPRKVSQASSVEWKKCLSSHVSKFEGVNNRTLSQASAANVSYVGPRVAHVREQAEIESSFDYISASLQADRDDWPDDIDTARAVTPPVQSLNDTQDRWRPKDATKTIEKPPIPLRSSLRIRPSLPALTMRNLPAAAHEQDVKDVKLRPSASLQAMSVNSTARREEALCKRRARMEGRMGVSPKHSSPGLTAAVERQFGRIMIDSSPQRFCKDVDDENLPPSARDRAGHSGSKVMVEEFLSSRRQRVAGSTGDSTMGNSPAFL